MKFPPQTDEQIESAYLLEPNTYRAQVVKAEEKVSKNGNMYINLTLSVGDKVVYDMISPFFFQHKFKHFFKSAGKLDLYEKGDVAAEDCMRLNVIAIIDREHQEGYKPKNVVYDYVLESECKNPILDGPTSTPQDLAWLE